MVVFHSNTKFQVILAKISLGLVSKNEGGVHLAASEHFHLWKSSKCFSKPPTLVFHLKFPENPPPCCICLYFIPSLYKGRTFCDELLSICPRHAEGPAGGCAPGPGGREAPVVPRACRGPAALQIPRKQSPPRHWASHPAQRCAGMPWLALCR